MGSHKIFKMAVREVQAESLKRKTDNKILTHGVELQP